MNHDKFCETAFYWATFLVFVLFCLMCGRVLGLGLRYWVEDNVCSPPAHTQPSSGCGCKEVVE